MTSESNIDESVRMAWVNAVARKVTDIINLASWEMNPSPLPELYWLEGVLYMRQEEELIPMDFDQIDFLALIDFQTGVYNFRHFLRKLQHEVLRARVCERPISLLVVALSGIAEINNQFGYAAGDEATRSAANLLVQATRLDIDFVGRFLPDRFAVALPETPGEGSLILAERIRRRFELFVVKHQWYELRMTASIGVTYVPGHYGDAEEMLAQADIAAEMILQRGGNAVVPAPLIF